MKTFPGKIKLDSFVIENIFKIISQKKNYFFDIHIKQKQIFQTMYKLLYNS